MIDNPQWLADEYNQFKLNHTLKFHNEGECVGTFDFNTPVLKFEGDADASAQVLIKYLGHHWNTYYNQLKELQEAVMALDVEDAWFEHDPAYDEYMCVHCCSREVHDSSCPVTKLRQVLKEQGVSDENIRTNRR